MPEAPDELLTFDELRARVGAAQHRTRAALRLRPIHLESDRRQLRYRAQWVAPIQQWLRDRDHDHDYDYPGDHDDVHPSESPSNE